MTPPTPYQDYIPASDADFALWMDAFGPVYLGTGLTSPAALDIDAANTVYQNALSASSVGATRGPATIAAKDAARASAEALGRLGAQAMVAAYNNGVLTAEQLTEASVRVPSTLNTPRLAPISGPDLGLRCITPGQLSLTVFDPLTSTFKKPIGVVGAEIWRGVWSGARRATRRSKACVKSTRRGSRA